MLEVSTTHDVVQQAFAFTDVFLVVFEKLQNPQVAHSTVIPSCNFLWTWKSSAKRYQQVLGIARVARDHFHVISFLLVYLFSSSCHMTTKKPTLLLLRMLPRYLKFLMTRTDMT